MESLLEGLSSGFMTNALLLVIGIYVFKIRERTDFELAKIRQFTYKTHGLVLNIYENKQWIRVKTVKDS